jgi:hypothetical protein
MARFIAFIREFWLAVTRQKPRRANSPDVILHDPAAHGPRDLDDPFFDPKVQSRVGSVIAKNAAKKEPRQR